MRKYLKMDIGYILKSIVPIDCHARQLTIIVSFPMNSVSDNDNHEDRGLAEVLAFVDAFVDDSVPRGTGQVNEAAECKGIKASPARSTNRKGIKSKRNPSWDARWRAKKLSEVATLRDEVYELEVYLSLLQEAAGRHEAPRLELNHLQQPDVSTSWRRQAAAELRARRLAESTNSSLRRAVASRLHVAKKMSKLLAKPHRTKRAAKVRYCLFRYHFMNCCSHQLFLVFDRRELGHLCLIRRFKRRMWTSLGRHFRLLWFRRVTPSSPSSSGCLIRCTWILIPFFRGQVGVLKKKNRCHSARTST